MNFFKYDNKIIYGFCLIVIILSVLGRFYKKQFLPEGFVFLTDIDPTIIESVRYYSDENFLARRIPGYTQPRVICTKQAAMHLTMVQRELKKQGFQLVVYDGYRPQQAVDAFMRWSHDESDQAAKAGYYPTVNKKDVFKLNYVAEKSSHSRGSTFDVTIIPTGQSLHPIVIERHLLTNGEEILFLNDNTTDMGSSFDLFHDVSHHDTPLIDDQAQQMRQLLREVMKKFNFKEYPEEWWHYTLENEPYPETYFNFSA